MEARVLTKEKNGGTKTKTLLAIDDVNSTLDIINCALCKNYSVVKMPNGKEALDWMQEGNLPDLIISDLYMPEMDGFEFIKHIRASGFFKDIPLIVLSSYESSATRINCLRLGADDYMVKPFNPEELEARVENIVKRSYKYSI
jgi:two-component system, chemotaxis family, chemotaxis protein CheY